MKHVISIALISILGFLSEPQASGLNNESNCKEFIELESDHQPRFNFWIEGFGRNGFVQYEELDLENKEILVPIVLKECIRSQKSSH